MTNSPPAHEPQFDSAKCLQEAEKLHQQGAIDQAEHKCQEVLSAFPKHFGGTCLLGAIRYQQGRYLEALHLLTEALKQNEKSASALSNLGTVLKKLGRCEEAVASFDKALAIKPDHVEALNNRGNALWDLGRLKEAVTSFDRALAIKPGLAEVLANRGSVLKDIGRLEEAVTSFDRALAIKPDHAEVLAGRGNALKDLGRLAEAVTSFDKTLAIRSNDAEVLANRGSALRDLGRLEEAVASFDKALAIRPDYAAARNHRGNALKELKRFAEAMASFDGALASNPDSASALFNRGLCKLLLGDLPGGWRDYESRWDCSGTPPRQLKAPYPAWNGEDISGKRIIVYAEQGMGDAIQFSRYLKRLCASGAKVTVFINASMHRLMKSLDAAVRVTDRHPKGETFDYQCALASLPRAFGTTLGSIPASIPYLFPENALIDKWRKRVGSSGLKIGICWQGNSASAIDVGRSVPLRHFRTLAEIPGVRLISLQKQHGLDQLAELSSEIAVETLGSDFDDGMDAFIDTAAVMSCLDLIVTSDTSIAHLAGALGRPVWVALKWVPDWRWMLDRVDSPWYPTMVLYRQTAMNDWNGVFDRIAADVSALAKGNAKNTEQLAIPGSIGELCDKITILEIKAARIGDAEKLRNVMCELDLLRALEAKCELSSDEQSRLVAELKSINEALWDIEDAIRDCEHRQEFGAEFIELARSVYMTNDRRAALKKKINTLWGSKIIEEKSYSGSNSKQ